MPRLSGSASRASGGIAVTRKLLKLVVALGVTAALLAGLVVGLAPEVKVVATAWDISFDKINIASLSETSQVVDSAGKLIDVRFQENRDRITLAEMSQPLIDAVVGSEDSAFFVHKGVSVKGVLRAATNNAAGSSRQGGSTITQQLVKNLVETPAERSTRGLSQKLREASLAIRLEHQLTKQQILELYLNAIYFGNGAYGVQAASQVYFGKNASEITIGEGALLAALIPAPSEYEPILHPDRARVRRAIVLDRLVSLGTLTRQQAFDISVSPLPEVTHKPATQPQGYFLTEVVNELKANPALGATEQERDSAIKNGGLKIYTTLDSNAQAAAEAARTSELPDSGGKFTAALVSIDPRTGAVRAMLGGRPTENSSDFNVATSGPGRSPGSSFKTFVLIAALEAGFNVTDVIDGSSPCTFAKADGSGQKDYVVSGHAGGGTLERQYASSINCAYVRLGQIVGLDKVAQVAQRLGITTKLHPANVSMPLGTDTVLPFDMASAFAAIANDGVRNKPYYVERVEDRFGRVVFQHTIQPQRAIAPEVARQMLEAMQMVVQGGTGTKAQLAGGRPAGGKTGTNEGGTTTSSDAWFVGVTPQLATAVWIGDPKGNTPLDQLKGGATVYGGDFPARIWKVYTDKALAGTPVLGFPAPPTPSHPGVGLCLNAAAKPYKLGNAEVPIDYFVFTNGQLTCTPTTTTTTTVPASPTT